MTIQLDPFVDHVLREYQTRDLNDPDFQIVATVNISSLAKAYRRAIDALLVVANDEKIGQWLQENDPKAYEQIVETLTNPYGI